MKDFDEARATRPTLDEDARSFKLAGETFTIRPFVRADTLAAAGRVSDKSSIADDVDAFDELIVGFLEDADHERYLALRRRETDPVTFNDLMELAAWMVETSSGRPTRQPSPSTAGPGKTGDGSTGESPLQAVS